MIPRTVDPRCLQGDRTRFSRWERKVDRFVRQVTAERQPPPMVEALESLWHRKERVGIKIERLAVSRARGELTLRRDLDRAWRDLEEAWELALRLHSRLETEQEPEDSDAGDRA